MPQRYIQRHVRQYASSVGLNSNDEEHSNITSYSTRVEKVVKEPGSTQWTVTLRRMTPVLGGKVKADWWEEMFDAVVVGMFPEADSPWVPDVPNLKEWAQRFPRGIYHGRDYRTPKHLKSKVCNTVYLSFYRFYYRLISECSCSPL